MKEGAQTDLPDGAVGSDGTVAKPANRLGITRRQWILALSILPILALANVAFLAWPTDRAPLFESIVKPHYLVFAVGLVFVPAIVNSVRLWLWGHFFALDLSPAKSVRIVTGTMVANAVTPAASGGPAVRWLLMVFEGIPGKRALTILSFQVTEDMLVLFSFVGISATLTGFAAFDALAGDAELLERLGISARSLVSGGVVGVTTAGAILLAAARGWFGSRVSSWFAQLGGIVRTMGQDWASMVRDGKRYAFAGLALTIIQWSAQFSVATLVIAAFGAQWRPMLYWLLQYLVQAISSVVPTPGGAGGAEAAFLLLFAPFLPDTILWTAMTLWRLLFFYLPLTVAAVVFFALNRARARRVAAQD